MKKHPPHNSNSEEIPKYETETNKKNVHLGLVHWPVKDRKDRTVATNVTHFDIHDIARACRSYGVGEYHIIHPLEEQRMFVSRVLDHWRTGLGVKFNPMRKTALNLVKISPHLEEALKNFPDRPYVVGTAARRLQGMDRVSFQGLRVQALEGRSIFLVFGTGFGLHEKLLEQCDGVLEPIEGAAPDNYRHLSVRSAVSICPAILANFSFGYCNPFQGVLEKSLRRLLS